MSISNEDRDTQLQRALSLVTGNETPERLAVLRVMAGTASPLYRPGRRFWNWLFDTEYTQSLPGMVWVGIAALGLAMLALILAAIFL